MRLRRDKIISRHDRGKQKGSMHAYITKIIEIA